MKTAESDVFDRLFSSYPELLCCEGAVLASYEVLADVYDNGCKLLICGNGGSAADSEHITGELMKGFNLKRPLSAGQRKAFSGFDNAQYIADNLQNALPAISLVSQTALMTAFLNDVAPDMLFAQQVFGYLTPGDALIALSTSGGSANVVNAACTAVAQGGSVVAITGRKKSRLSDVATVTINLPADTPFEVQELTLPVYHAICAALELRYFDK